MKESMKLFQLEQLLVLQKVLKIGNFIMYIIIMYIKRQLQTIINLNVLICVLIEFMHNYKVY